MKLVLPRTPQLLCGQHDPFPLSQASGQVSLEGKTLNVESLALAS